MEIFLEAYMTEGIRVACDIYWSTRRDIRMFAYYKPLCYQLFPHTVNSEMWNNIAFKKAIDITQLNVSTKNYSSILKFTKAVVMYIAMCVGIFLLIIIFVIVNQTSSK